MKFCSSFWVEGRPRQKGNLIAVCPRGCPGNINAKGGRPFVTESFRGDAGKRLRRWLDDVRSFARNPPRPIARAVSLDVWFYFAQPASNRDPYPTTRSVADFDKLVRSVADALSSAGKQTGRMYLDDAQIVDASQHVRWADERGEGALIEVCALEEEQLPLLPDAPDRPARLPHANAAKRAHKRVKESRFKF